MLFPYEFCTLRIYVTVFLLHFTVCRHYWQSNIRLLVTMYILNKTTRTCILKDYTHLVDKVSLKCYLGYIRYHLFSYIQFQDFVEFYVFLIVTTYLSSWEHTPSLHYSNVFKTQHMLCLLIGISCVLNCVCYIPFVLLPDYC